MASKVQQKKSLKPKKEPKYYEKAEIVCACGNVIVTGSTVAKTQIEVCSVCHPFYTGSSRFIDTAGRVDKFRQRLAKARGAKLRPKETRKKNAKQKD